MVRNIGTFAFGPTINLVSITVDSANPIFHSDGNCCIKTATNEVVFGCKTSVIPDYITSIGYGAFNRQTTLTSIIIPDSVTKLSGQAFWGCSGLTSITIPSSITRIAEEVFYNCYGLTSISIPSTVMSIGSYTFGHCKNLTSFKFEGDAVAEATNVFYNTGKLTSIHINPFATGYGETWGGKSVVVDNPVYYKGKRICKAYLGSKRKRKRP